MVPTNRKSKARTRTRRAQHDKVSAANIIWCESCGARKLPHRVCLSCGKYKGRQVIAIIER